MLKNIETKIKLATICCLASFATSIIFVFVISINANRQVSDSRKVIYVMDNSNIPIAATQTDLNVNRAAVYKAHIRNFHTLFFSLTPDDKFIEYQMRQAMYLVDESGALQYNNLKEKGFFSSILSSSAVLTLMIDSVILDEPKKYFRLYGKQKIDRRSSTITRSLITEGYLHDLDFRSDNNPAAVLITRWKTLENKDLENVQKNNF